jgi:tRNA threonylcarbamoyladenosine biosynthesis protein TsaB
MTVVVSPALVLPVNVLAISASTALCSVVLDTPNQRYEWHTAQSNQHSEQLLPAIQGLLYQAGLTRVDVIAVDIGPGAFTSVRVACAVTQGLALGWNCGVLAVESLTALAYQYQAQQSVSDTAAVTLMTVLDARMNECYVAQYVVDAQSVQSRAAPCLVPYAFEMLPIFQNSEVLMGNFDPTTPHPTASFMLANPLAIGVLLAAKSQLNRGILPMLAEAVQPLYVREQVAFTMAERALTARLSATVSQP